MDWDIRRFSVIDSTNRWVSRQAAAGAAEGLIAVSDFQSAGRGRRDRRWESPAGTALLCSVLLQPVLAVDRWPLAGAAVALAAVAACAGVAPAVPVSLKWPNDLVVGDAKLAGVLAEAVPGVGAVVVGLGLNLSWSPPGAARLGAVDRDAVFGEWMTAMDHLYGDWPAVAASLRSHCSTLGRQVRVELAGGSFTGRAVDLTDAGHLVVDTGPTLRTVTAADVVHLRAVPRK
ncbi:MAG: biotin--[acetyl-CoA-carboxylase] ligase [Acidimicrobiales bacterium]